jgi:cytidyltransferase-like protein
MFRKVVIGGTFDMLHKGHKTLLATGFQVAESVVIGLTSDDFARRFRVGDVLAYENRKGNLEGFLKAYKKPYKIVKIDDSYGVATLDKGIDCIVASEETLLRASEINAIRFKKGLDKLTIVVVPIMVADDGKPISSDRINSGEIDDSGRIINKKKV